MQESELKNIVYASVSLITEEREHNGSYHGNGHHLAQEITSAVVAALKLAEGQKPPTNSDLVQLLSECREFVVLRNGSDEESTKVTRIIGRINAVLAQQH
jgi:hypothetical protein